jgi:hypothetical protein
VANSTITVSLLTLALSAISPIGGTTTRDASALKIEPLGDAQLEAQRDISNLLLNAVGRKSVPPGKVAIPVPGDVVTYEVIVSAPGAARLIHAHPKPD